MQKDDPQNTKVYDTLMFSSSKNIFGEVFNILEYSVLVNGFTKRCTVLIPAMN